MVAPWVDDLTPFFDLDAFAETATYYSPLGIPTDTNLPGALTSPPTDGAVVGFELTILFDAAYAPAQGIGGMGVESSSPVAWCRTADVPVSRRGSTLTRAGIVYNVVEARPDGHGVTMLILSEV